jgi:ATP-dependent Clp protease protease subunit
MSEEDEMDIIFEQEEEFRVLGLYGDVEEENSKELVGALYACLNEGRKSADPIEPIELLISTGGGNVSDMFAIYDVMRMTREVCDISTLGIGKVMSAGVLLLAAGTKGQRRIGKHCRIMLHHVLTTDSGSLANMRCTVREATAMEELMFDALVAETDLTKKKLELLLKENTDKFFCAEEALQMGIADIIV